MRNMKLFAEIQNPIQERVKIRRETNIGRKPIDINRLAAYIGLAPNFDAFLNWILDLRKELHVPHTLKDFGVGKENFAVMAKMAPEDPTAGGNPVALTEKDALMLFERAYNGEMRNYSNI